MKAIIEKSILKGEIQAPPSKSFLHRMLMCAALAKGVSTISNIAESQDILATLDCIENLGAKWERVNEDPLKAGDGDCFKVIGGLDPNTENAVFNCRESGSTLRFFVPLALALCKKAVFKGTPRLMERGIGIYEQVLGEKGAVIKRTEEGILIEGELKPGKYVVPGNISSQYITGLMFALPLLSGSSEIKVIPPVESRPYIDITIAVLRLAGIEITETEKNTFVIEGSQQYSCINVAAEGDWSNAAFLYALRAMGNDLEIFGLNADSTQGDKICISDFEKLKSPGAVIDISESIDLGPILFAFAAANHGGVFTGTRRLKIKESDRATVMAEELRKLGAVVTVEEDRVVIEDKPIHAPETEIDGHNDHRIVMSMAVVLLKTGGTICGAEAISKSYPDFFEVIRRLKANVEIR